MGFNSAFKGLNIFKSRVTDRVKNEEIWRGVQEERNVLLAVKWRKDNWIGHVFWVGTAIWDKLLREIVTLYRLIKFPEFSKYHNAFIFSVERSKKSSSSVAIILPLKWASVV